MRQALPGILGSYSGTLSRRMVRLIVDLAEDWRRLDERIAAVSVEIEALAAQDESCQRLMSVPGVGPIISSAVVAAIGRWSACMKDKGRKASDPYRAMEQGLVETDTQDSIALALDDIDCKEQTRLIEVWFKEESAVQKRLIKENKDQLDVVKTRTRDVLTAAKAVK